MTALPQQSYLSPHEYLDIERLAETKSDYLNGIMVAMAGARYRHNLVAGALNRLIGNAFVDRPFIAFGSDMKVRIEKANVFRYPDTSALCGPIDFYDATEDSYHNPAFIGEVLSESTRRIDRNEKFAEYRLLDSFREYLLVEPDEVMAELHRKDGDGRWTVEVFQNLDDEIHLESIDVVIGVKDLYAKVTFPEVGNP